MNSCQRCKSERLVCYGAKTSDMNHLSVMNREHDGYMPGDFGIGDGDYVELDYCLDCGQIQGEWPRPLTDLESPECELCGERVPVSEVPVKFQRGYDKVARHQKCHDAEEGTTGTK